jgi:CRISPR type I-E-associated protein CasB/Cse2
MPRIAHRGEWYWTSFDPAARYAGSETAILRKGVGRDVGSVPELWRFYTVIVPDRLAAHGRITPQLAAEHAALTLFGIHQQSQKTPMHQEGEHIGAALLKLRARPQFSGNPEALDRRVNAAATSTSVTELVFHLRGLVTLLRGEKLPLDYTMLIEDMADWHYPDRQARARRRWGANYYAWGKQNAQTESAGEPAHENKGR